MRKAFIFTLDALFAIVVLAFFLTAISLELNVPRETYWLPSIANSMMTSLDEQGAFYHAFREDDAQVQSALNSYLDALPGGINSQITVKIYTVSGSTFSLFKTIQASRGTIGTKDKTFTKRIFIDVNEKKFGLAELVLSYG